VASGFVSKLAAAGARDPEALAAWIGRKKHGKAAFAKLSSGGQKKASSKASGSPQKTAASQARDAERERNEGALARLRDMAAARTATRENRPAEVTADVEQVKKALDRFKSGLGSGNIARVPDERLSQYASTLQKVQNRPPAEFDRSETRALYDFGHLVRTEARRRNLPV
jgi:hypothetical protein